MRFFPPGIYLIEHNGEKIKVRITDEHRFLKNFYWFYYLFNFKYNHNYEVVHVNNIIKRMNDFIAYDAINKPEDT